MGRWVELQQTASLFSSEMKTQAFSLHLLPWLSNFETNQGYKDRQDPSLTLIFPINSNEPKFKDTSILVWTTTPWILYSNFCIVVGPDMDYNLVEADGKKYWIAASRTAAYFKNPNIVDTCKGSELVGKDYEPLSRISDAFVTPDQLSRHYKIYPADYVSTEDGTGAVHTAPSFGFLEGGSIPLAATAWRRFPLPPLRVLRRRTRNSRLSPPTRPNAPKMQCFPQKTPFDSGIIYISHRK